MVTSVSFLISSCLILSMLISSAYSAPPDDEMMSCSIGSFVLLRAILEPLT